MIDPKSVHVGTILYVKGVNLGFGDAAPELYTAIGEPFLNGMGMWSVKARRDLNGHEEFILLHFCV
jgi:hypothetical protein